MATVFNLPPDTGAPCIDQDKRRQNKKRLGIFRLREWATKPDVSTIKTTRVLTKDNAGVPNIFKDQGAVSR
jgi:hypothetical protein